MPKTKKLSNCFVIKFVAMGQGDCVMIRCPDGRIAVVDCGTTNAGQFSTWDWFLEECFLMRDASWAGGNNNTIDALILTHPDGDHCNKVMDLLLGRSLIFQKKLVGPRTKIAIKNQSKKNCKPLFVKDIYYSCNRPLKAKSGLDAKKEFTGYSNVKSNISSIPFQNLESINQIIINEDWSIIRRMELDSKHRLEDKYEKHCSEKDCQEENCNISMFEETTHENRHVVLQSQPTDKVKWSISIIAGNVKKISKNDSSNQSNASSLITLLEYDGKKTLLCGDATQSTEEFLRTTHKTLISNIDLLMIPHHGSKHASTKEFIKLTAPKHAVVSCAFFELTHLHPVSEIIKDWGKSTIKFKDNKHYVDVWQESTKDKAIKQFRYWLNSNSLIFEIRKLGVKSSMYWVPTEFRKYVQKITKDKIVTYEVVCEVNKKIIDDEASFRKKLTENFTVDHELKKLVLFAFLDNSTGERSSNNDEKVQAIKTKGKRFYFLGGSETSHSIYSTAMGTQVFKLDKDGAHPIDIR